MPPESAEFQCNNSECRVAQTGKCVEGLSLDKCPHLIRVAELMAAEGAVPSSEPVPEPQIESDLELPRAERLDAVEASAILRTGSARLIAIVGPTSSGKTSLIASLCNLFQKGPVDQLLFARSRTLFAFEQACHHARAASRRNRPQTAHTHLSSGVGFYHLALMEDGTLTHLLLSDRPGEDYRSVADDPVNAVDFIEIRRADSIVVMVNGQLLLDLRERHDVRPDTLMIIQGLKDGDVLSGSQRLAVVLTKLDAVNSAPVPEQDRALRGFDEIVSAIKARFGPNFHEILPFKIAASPATEILPYAYGSDELLHSWMQPQMSPDFPSDRPEARRAMGRYGMADARSEA